MISCFQSQQRGFPFDSATVFHQDPNICHEQLTY